MDSAHKYFAQVRGQLSVTKIEVCNLAIYMQLLEYTVSQLNLINLIT